LFEYLRLSPSYELARKEAQEGLTPEQQRALPADFDEVRRTYKLLGDVQKVLYRAWWIDHGLPAFGTASSRPRVHELGFLPGAKDGSANDVVVSVQNYVEETRREEGLPASLLVAVPIGIPKTEVLARISKLLDARRSPAVAAEPQLKLQGQRLRAKALFKGIRLLWFRAARPKWQLWRLGAWARINPHTAAQLDVQHGRSTEKNPTEIIDRARMTKSVSRDLSKYERIAENAARGRFPSDADVPMALFDYPQLARRISRKNAWERAEKARLLKQREERAALRAQLLARNSDV
jgi:hypothetical protein